MKTYHFLLIMAEVGAVLVCWLSEDKSAAFAQFFFYNLLAAWFMYINE